MTQQFAIRKNIPYPGRTSGAGRPHKVDYPFDELEVGDSFFFPSDKRNFSDEQSLMRALWTYRRNTKRNLVWAKEPGGFGIWREPGEAETRTYQRTRSAKGDNRDSSESSVSPPPSANDNAELDNAEPDRASDTN